MNMNALIADDKIRQIPCPLGKASRTPQRANHKLTIFRIATTAIGAVLRLPDILVAQLKLGGGGRTVIIFEDKKAGGDSCIAETIHRPKTQNTTGT